MKNNLIISISREYGSGGREIGENLASSLGFAYYDKKLIEHIIEESGFCTEVVNAYDEKIPDRFFFTPNSFFTGSDVNQPIAAKIHTAEVETMRQAAEKGSCVIIGRCADSVLSSYPGLVSIFISAPMEDRITRVMRRNELGRNEAKSRIAKTDKARAAYYRYFADKKWGDAGNYDLCINSGRLSISDAVEVISSYIHRLKDTR